MWMLPFRYQLRLRCLHLWLLLPLLLHLLWAQIFLLFSVLDLEMSMFLSAKSVSFRARRNPATDLPPRALWIVASTVLLHLV